MGLRNKKILRVTIIISNNDSSPESLPIKQNLDQFELKTFMTNTKLIWWICAKWGMVFYLYIYSYILVTVVKEFIKQDQQIKRTLDNSLQEQKYLSHPFFFIVFNSGIILVKSFGKLNQQFNLKQKFSVSSDPKKTQFLVFMT